MTRCPDPSALGIFPEYWEPNEARKQHLAARLNIDQKKFMYTYLDTHIGVGFPATKTNWREYFGIASVVSALMLSDPGKKNIAEHRRNKALLSGHSQPQENNIPCEAKRRFSEVLCQDLETEVCNPAQFLPLLCFADICGMYRFQQVKPK